MSSSCSFLIKLRVGHPLPVVKSSFSCNFVKRGEKITILHATKMAMVVSKQVGKWMTWPALMDPWSPHEILNKLNGGSWGSFPTVTSACLHQHFFCTRNPTRPFSMPSSRGPKQLLLGSQQLARVFCAIFYTRSAWHHRAPYPCTMTFQHHQPELVNLLIVASGTLGPLALWVIESHFPE